VSVYPHLPARRPARAPQIPTTPRAHHRSDDAHRTDPDDPIACAPPIRRRAPHRSRRPHRVRTTDPTTRTAPIPTTPPRAHDRSRQHNLAHPIGHPPLVHDTPSQAAPGVAIGIEARFGRIFVPGSAPRPPRSAPHLARAPSGRASPAPRAQVPHPRVAHPRVAHPRGRPPPACTTRRRTRLPVLPWASRPGSGCYSCPTPTTSPMCTTRRRTRLPVLPWTSRPGSGGYSCSNVDVAAATPLSDSEVTTSHSCV
jgi:hypothetical protein